jgi:hypothetical protein
MIRAEITHRVDVPFRASGRIPRAALVLRDLGPSQAAELAAFATGATIPGTIFLMTPGQVGRPGAEWPRLIAHELTHLAQIELAGRHATPAQWLTEGMAEWVAYRGPEVTDLDDNPSLLALARNAAVGYVARAGGLDLKVTGDAGWIHGAAPAHRRATDLPAGPPPHG